jgi:DNA (cytosine-5)-methyltransferase 1
LPQEKKGLSSNNDGLVFPTDFDGWDPNNWDLKKHLPIIRGNSKDMSNFKLKEDEIEVLEAWEALLQVMLVQRNGLRLPGFPLWSDLWGKRPIYEKQDNAPDWKRDFEEKNRRFYLEHRKVIDDWLSDYPVIRKSAPSRRKLEWQAQDMQSIWDGLIHFRPSGIRVKRATYVPTLVAITQTSIYGPHKRRLTVQESARLQGMNRDFDFGAQSDQASYKQLGNGVSVGAVFQVVKAAVERDQEILAITAPKIVRSVKRAPASPYI